MIAFLCLALGSSAGGVQNCAECVQYVCLCVWLELHGSHKAGVDTFVVKGNKIEVMI